VRLAVTQGTFDGSRLEGYLRLERERAVLVGRQDELARAPQGHPRADAGSIRRVRRSGHSEP
jgi:hypothetical protein